MNNQQSISLNSDYNNLRLKLTRAKVLLNELYEERYQLEEIKRAVILSEYDKHFHHLEINIQRQALFHSEVQRRSELLLMKKQRGETLTPEIIDLVHKIVDKEFAVLRNRIAQLQQGPEKKPKVIIANNINQEKECLKLYKDLVKILHPDTCQDQTLTNKYWHSVQAAYEAYNLHTLQAIHSLLMRNSEVENKVLDIQSTENISEEINRIESIINKEKKSIEELRKTPPYCYELGLQDETWIAKHAQTLQSQVDEYEKKITYAQGIIKMLTGSEWKFSQEDFNKQNPIAKEQQDFNDEFVQSTYFSGRH